MTAICGGGPSAAISGFNQTVVVTSASIEAFLTLLGFEPLALVLAPLIAGETYDLTTFCTTDPPADPGLTPGDLIDVTNFTDPTVSIPALAKFQQWFNSRYWYQVCRCTSVSTPAPPALSNPGAPSQNPGLPSSGNTPCSSNTHTITANVVSSLVTHTIDITPFLLPVSGSTVEITGSVIANTAGLTATGWPVPPSLTEIDNITTGVTWSTNPDNSNSSGVHLQCGINFADSSGNWLSGGFLGQSLDSVGSRIENVRKGTSPWGTLVAYISMSCRAGIDGARAGQSESVTINTTGICLGSLEQACCPPDPQITTKLDQIFGLLQNVYSIIPVRPSVYAVGTAHAGLTGGGTLSLASSTTALLVVINTLPAAYGLVVGTPDTYIDVGWLTPINNAGPTAGLRISRASETFELPDATDAVDYSLPPGESITITELQPG